MPVCGVLAIGGSAGGVEALLEVVAGLPADLPACVLVTVHIGERARTRLPEIVARAGPLPARHARHGDSLRPGQIYIAPPGYHLLARDERTWLSTGPTVNRHRPAVDVMFASAARWADGHTVALVLSGMLDDGAVGSALVARAGGHVLVQEPAEALFDPMPRAALAAVPEARAVPAARAGIAARTILAELADRPISGGDRVTPRHTMEDSGDPRFLAEDESSLTRLTCPECSGVLAQLRLPSITYYRCHTGHQFGPQTLEASQRQSTEAKLWTAVAALEEHAALARHLAGQPTTADLPAAEFLGNADRSAHLARLMRARLMPPPELVEEPAAPSDGRAADPPAS